MPKKSETEKDWQTNRGRKKRRIRESKADVKNGCLMERERSGKETSKLKPSSSHVAVNGFKTK